MEFFIILLVAVVVFGFKSFVVIPQQEVPRCRKARTFPPRLDCRPQHPHSLYRPRRLPSFAKRNPLGCTQPGLHHARQYAADC